ncbi:aTP-dependent DNA helicase [Streptococcus thermophilus CAG:236]|nr:aTP-dependent DNA helicase [Streptococcus thermophilus CAG:236]
MSLQQALKTRKANAQPQKHTGAQPFSKATGGLPFSKASDSGNSATDWKIGDIAHHKKWGDGTVLEVTGSGKTQELKIKFPEVGLKKVLASVAPIVKK